MGVSSSRSSKRYDRAVTTDDLTLDGDIFLGFLPGTTNDAGEFVISVDEVFEGHSDGGSCVFPLDPLEFPIGPPPAPHHEPAGFGVSYDEISDQLTDVDFEPLDEVSDASIDDPLFELFEWHVAVVSTGSDHDDSDCPNDVILFFSSPTIDEYELPDGYEWPPHDHPEESDGEDDPHDDDLDESDADDFFDYLDLDGDALGDPFDGMDDGPGFGSPMDDPFSPPDVDDFDFADGEPWEADLDSPGNPPDPFDDDSQFDEPGDSGPGQTDPADGPSIPW